MNVKDILGTGLKFPIEVTETGGVATISGAELVQQSIAVILSTSVGTRFFLPEFGSLIEKLLFEPNDVVLQSLLRDFIFEALEWEKRIRVTDVIFEKGVSPEVLNSMIYYEIVATNSSDAFIYPFYREIKY